MLGKHLYMVELTNSSKETGDEDSSERFNARQAAANGQRRGIKNFHVTLPLQVVLEGGLGDFQGTI